MLKKKIALFIAFSLVLTTVFIITPALKVSAGTQATYYVSPTGSDTTGNGSISYPWQTIQKARDVVGTINSNMTGDIYVYLRGGTYVQTSTLTFGSSDSGTNGYTIYYKAYTGETPVISGGKSITGWTLYDAAKNIYRSSAVSGGIETRQLYVNGVRADRAKSTSAQTSGYGFVKTATGYTTSDPALQNWGNITDIEVVGRTEWKEFRGKIASIIGTTITVQDPFWTESQAQEAVPLNLPYCLENAYELLDTEGEWYLDRPADVFYYRPRTGENMSTATIIAPELETLVTTSGTLDNIVHNIRFEGLTFSYATWLEPNTNKGYAVVQANYMAADGTSKDNFYDFWRNPVKAPANVVISAGKSITFERCKFNKLGGAGIDIQYGSQDNIIKGCEFSDISGTGLQIGDVKDTDRHPTDTRTIVKNNQIINNYIHDVCMEYRAGVGIFAGFTQDTLISHNEICNLPYSAISNGWGWGGTDFYSTPRDATEECNPTIQNNTRILKNHIFNFMQALGDGGGIYNLSSQPGLIAAGNVVHSVLSSGNMYYQDHGSRYHTVTDNLFYCDAPAGIGTWLGYSHNIINNYMSDLSSFNGYTGGNQWYQKDSATVYNYNTSEGVPAYILDNAGLESAYQDLLASPSINVALGKAVTARLPDGTVSSMHTGHEAKFAVDGDIDTYAQSNASWAWMEDVDLGKSYNIGKVRINFKNDGFATQYDILTSTNGTTWTTKAQVTNNTTGGWKEYNFEGADCRYVRVNMIEPDGPNQTGVQACINEIETIGKLSTGTAPDTFPAITAVPDPVRDVACQKTAVGRDLSGNVSPMHIGHEADKAIDGDSGTYAQATNNWAWMEDVDLGSVYNINKVRINYTATGFSTQYDIQISLDNSNWTTVVSVTDSTSGGWKEHTFDPKAARYVRLKMIKPDGPDQIGGQAAIYDFEVYRYDSLEHKKSVIARYLDGSIATMHVGHEADKATDTIDDTYAQATYQYPWMLDVDLGGVFERVDDVEIVFVDGGFATDFDILVSSDNVNWTTVKQIRNNTSWYIGRCTFTPVAARYVRLKMIKPDGPNQTGGQAGVQNIVVREQDNTGFIATTRTDGTTGVNKNNLQIISLAQYTFQSGDVIEYDVMLLSNENDIGGLDLTTNDSLYLRAYTWNDQNGLSGYGGNITSKAYHKWYHRILPIPSEMIGHTAQRWDIVFENDSASKTFQVIYDNIVVKRNGTVVQTIYKDGSPSENLNEIRTYYDPCTINTYSRYEWGRDYWCD